jgi:hypothetical protein
MSVNGNVTVADGTPFTTVGLALRSNRRTNANRC